MADGQVNAPLAIKTRIHQTLHPNTALDPVKRERVYLEILAQNVSPEGMIFDRVVLEPVNGLSARTTSAIASSFPSTGEEPEDAAETSTETLLPGETRQHLFVLVPISDTPTDAASGSYAKSTFLPYHPPGTILPLGRLDLTWRSGPAHDPGRLQTSTLNRRIPVTSMAPARTLSSASPQSSGRVSPRPPIKLDDDLSPSWEFDLVILDRKPVVEVEKEFEITLRLAVRSARAIEEEGEPVAPTPPILGVQYLLHRPTASAPEPSFTLSPPSRSATPMIRANSNASGISRPFSPMSQAGESRPMTPVSSQLRQATTSHIGSPSLAASQLVPAPTLQRDTFPPSPTTRSSAATLKPRTGQDIRGEVRQLGASLMVIPPHPLEMVEEKAETTYADPIAPSRRWETTYAHTIRYIALDEGLAELGGVRVLLLDDETVRAGSAGREWESLGDVWVEG